MQVDTSLHMVDIFISKNNYKGILTPEIAKVNYHKRKKAHFFMCFFSMENFARPSSSDTKDNQNTYIISLRYVKSQLYKRKKMHEKLPSS